MSKSFKTTTSNHFETETIRDYLGIVSSSVVAGTGFFSDVAAAFSDLFGGRSNSYKSQLDSIRSEALQELEVKARRLGANAVVAISIDIDQISGKNNQMLMISATGTAVVLETNYPNEQVDSQSNIANLTPDELDLECRMKQLSTNTDQLSLQDIFEEYKDVFDQKPNVNQSRVLVRKLLQLPYTPSSYGTDLKKALHYLSLFTPEDLSDVVYDEISNISPTHSTKSMLLTIASKFNILDVRRMRKLFEDDNDHVAELALIIGRSDKVAYSESDIEVLETLIKIASERFQIKRELFDKKKKIGKDTRIWKCVNGHEVGGDVNFCNQCGIDRRDLPKHLHENFSNELVNKINKLKLVYSYQLL